MFNHHRCIISKICALLFTLLTLLEWRVVWLCHHKMVMTKQIAILRTFFVANTINEHFFVAKMIWPHLFWCKNDLHTLCCRKKNLRTLFCRENDLCVFFVGKTIYALRPENFALWKLPSGKFRLFGPLQRTNTFQKVASLREAFKNYLAEFFR